MGEKFRFNNVIMRKSTIYIPIRNPFKGDLSEQSYIDVLEIREDIIRESISDVFETSKKSGKNITRHNGVDYINDSTSTSIETSLKSLESAKNPVIWIIGEIDTEQDYTAFAKLINEKVKAIICITKGSNDLFKVFGKNHVQLMVNVASISEAVKIAFYIAQEGNTVLYSPASRVIEEGRNLQERSAIYNAVVERLKTMAY